MSLTLHGQTGAITPNNDVYVKYDPQVSTVLDIKGRIWSRNLSLIFLSLAKLNVNHLEMSIYIKISFQVGFIFNPALPKNSGQYSCTAKYGGRSNEYGINLNVLMQTTYV